MATAPPGLPTMILAGGQSSRMGGGDKCLRPLAGTTMLAHVLERLAGQTETLALNANGDAARFARFGLTVHGDAHGAFPGPLAGILTAMRWAQSLGADAVMTVPSDAPFLPLDAAHRLSQARMAQGADIALASSGGYRHPVIGIWPTVAADALDAALADGVRKVMHFAKNYTVTEVAFDDVVVGPRHTAIDPFFNANTPQDLAMAEELLSAGASYIPGGAGA